MNKAITLNTLSPSYDKTEDRIRLSINYQDIQNRIDLMLTRALLLDLLPSLEEYIEKFYFENTEIKTNTFQKKQIIKEKTTSTKAQNHIEKEQIKKTNMDDLYLYKNTQELLQTITLNYNKESKITTLTFISNKDTKVIAKCDEVTLKNISNALKKTIPYFSWGISQNF